MLLYFCECFVLIREHSKIKHAGPSLGPAVIRVFLLGFVFAWKGSKALAPHAREEHVSVPREFCADCFDV